MAVTADLDVSMSTHIQFVFKFGCQDERAEWPKDEDVILQFSTNGGMWWSLLRELHHTPDTKPRYPTSGRRQCSGKRHHEQIQKVTYLVFHCRYFNLPLPTPAQTNSTRFRFWQPRHKGIQTCPELVSSVSG